MSVCGGLEVEERLLCVCERDIAMRCGVFEGHEGRVCWDCKRGRCGRVCVWMEAIAGRMSCGGDGGVGMGTRSGEWDP